MPEHTALGWPRSLGPRLLAPRSLGPRLLAPRSLGPRLLAPLFVLPVVLLAGCDTGITAGAMNAAVGPSFARLYLLQQHDLGQSRQPTDGRASCSRGDAASRNRGPGDDWVCTLNFPYPDGHIAPLAYDVTVNANGCYTADGPQTVVGQQHLTDTSGKTVTNPLFAFDGCLAIG